MGGNGARKRRNARRSRELSDKPEVKSKDGNASISTNKNDEDEEDVFHEELADDGSLTCKGCDKTFVDDSDRLIGCDRCLKWHCQLCAGISDTLYNAINDDSTNAVAWFCNVCVKPAKNEVRTGCLIEKKCKQIETKMESMRSALDLSINNAINKLRTEFNEKIEALKGDITTEATESAKKAASESVKEAVTTEQSTTASVKEIAEREERKSNIVVFNVPECISVVSEERVKHDEEYVTDLLKATKSEKLTVKKVFRLGPKADNARPLKVIFDSETSKTTMLKNCRHLKGNRKYDGVNVTKDLTFLERKERKNLDVERKRKQAEANEAGREERWIIVRGKVIKGRVQQDADRPARQ